MRGTKAPQLHVISHPYPAAKYNSYFEQCPCGREIKTIDMANHKRSKRHFKDLANLELAVKDDGTDSIDKANGWLEDDTNATGTTSWGETTNNANVANADASANWGEEVAAQDVTGGGWNAEATDAAGPSNVDGACGGGFSSGQANDGFTQPSGRYGRATGGQGRGSGGKGGGGGDDRECYNCHGFGHISRDCPKKQSGGPECYKCHEFGHISRHCTSNQNGSADRACHSCGESGHLSRECPTKENGGGSSSLECYNCHNFGHMSRDCPEEPKSRGGGGGGGRACFNCGLTGHIARECPEEMKPRERDPRGPKCYGCQGCESSFIPSRQ
jgi:cellular nucleic acid-binding protein